MDLKAYGFATHTKGPTLVVTLAPSDHRVLEANVRRAMDRADFDAARKGFVDLLSERGGVLESYEVAPVKGKIIEDMTIGMTLRIDGRFEAASSTFMQDPITQDFFTRLWPVAVQYAVSTGNT